MLARLTGLWPDGSTPDDTNEAVQKAARAELRIPQGASARVVLSLFTPNGVPFQIAAADMLYLTVKRKPQDGSPLVKLTGARLVTEGKHVALFTLTPAQTKNLDFGRYVFDVWMTKDAGGERNQVVKVSPFVLEAGALPP